MKDINDFIYLNDRCDKFMRTLSNEIFEDEESSEIYKNYATDLLFSFLRLMHAFECDKDAYNLNTLENRNTIHDCRESVIDVLESVGLSDEVAYFFKQRNFYLYNPDAMDLFFKIRNSI